VSTQLLALLKFALLGLLYLFLARVVRAVWAELVPPRLDGSPTPRGWRGRRRAKQSAASRGVPRSEPPVQPSAAPAATPGGMVGKGAVGVVTSPGARHTGQLVVVEPGHLAGTSFPLSDGELTVGRGAGCSVVLDDRHVSSLHARVWHDGFRWLVEDLGSTNGTWLNGDQVGGPRPLVTGDHLALGNVVLEVR